MPAIKVLCPCSSIEQELNHWTPVGGCPLPPQAKAWYHGSLQRTLNDKRHCDGNVTITRLLDCPRKWLISDFLPWTFNPLRMFKADIGTLVQAEVARHAEAVGAQAEVKVAGRLFGIDVTGSLDMLSGSCINEGKFHAERRMDVVMGRAKWMPGVKQLLDDDYVAQMNMQRLLLEQSTSTYPVTYDIKQLQISHAGMEDASWPSEKAPLRDENWIANVRPKGGAFTVRQNAGFVSNFKSAAGSVEERLKATVPKVGATCWVNKKGESTMCNKYCEQKAACDAIG